MKLIWFEEDVADDTKFFYEQGGDCSRSVLALACTLTFYYYYDHEVQDVA